MGYSPQGRKESDTTEATQHASTGQLFNLFGCQFPQDETGQVLFHLAAAGGPCKSIFQQLALHLAWQGHPANGTSLPNFSESTYQGNHRQLFTFSAVEGLLLQQGKNSLLLDNKARHFGEGRWASHFFSVQHPNRADFSGEIILKSQSKVAKWLVWLVITQKSTCS